MVKRNMPVNSTNVNFCLISRQAHQESLHLLSRKVSGFIHSLVEAEEGRGRFSRLSHVYHMTVSTVMTHHYPTRCIELCGDTRFRI